MMEHAFNKFKEKDLSNLQDGDSDIIYYEEQKLKFVIADENFKPIYVTNKKKGSPVDSTRAQNKIKNSIISMIMIYAPTFVSR